MAVARFFRGVFEFLVYCGYVNEFARTGSHRRALVKVPVWTAVAFLVPILFSVLALGKAVAEIGMMASLSGGAFPRFLGLLVCVLAFIVVAAYARSVAEQSVSKYKDKKPVSRSFVVSLLFFIMFLPLMPMVVIMNHSFVASFLFMLIYYCVIYVALVRRRLVV
ncbi:hypothetical protein [Oleiagrimonas sp. MCCC 1A03011]|uniref:hypothetical protein n=1 Tax=Oleiagrimonas sp. MCCC 1A03011 TaxID=1926883 RepID=UPI0011BF996A|nr:hypothetical protein [Oleiagrimonas sp. MCCC 1A03011]